MGSLGSAPLRELEPRAEGTRSRSRGRDGVVENALRTNPTTAPPLPLSGSPPPVGAQPSRLVEKSQSAGPGVGRGAGADQMGTWR